MIGDLESEPLCTAREIRDACGLRDRDIEMLKREGLLPPVIGPSGRGYRDRLDLEGSATLVAIAALARAGTSVTAAARIMHAVLERLRHSHGGLPFGLVDFVRQVPAEIDREPMALIEAALRGGAPNLDERWPSDYVLSIADGEYVAERRADPVPMLSGASSSALFKFTYTGRGGEVHIEPADENPCNEIWPQDRVDRFFQERCDNAVALVELNLSLAMRQALAQIVRERGAAKHA